MLLNLNATNKKTLEYVDLDTLENIKLIFLFYNEY